MPANKEIQQVDPEVLVESIRIAIDDIPEEMKKPKVYKTKAKQKKSPEELATIRAENLIKGREVRAKNATMNAKKRQEEQAVKIAEEIYKKLREQCVKIPDNLPVTTLASSGDTNETPESKPDLQIKSPKPDIPKNPVAVRSVGRRVMRFF